MGHVKKQEEGNMLRKLLDPPIPGRRLREEDRQLG